MHTRNPTYLWEFNLKLAFKSLRKIGSSDRHVSWMNWAVKVQIGTGAPLHAEVTWTSGNPNSTMVLTHHPHRACFTHHQPESATLPWAILLYRTLWGSSTDSVLGLVTWHIPGADGRPDKSCLRDPQVLSGPSSYMQSAGQFFHKSLVQTSDFRGLKLSWYSR